MSRDKSTASSIEMRGGKKHNDSLSADKNANKLPTTIHPASSSTTFN